MCLKKKKKLISSFGLENVMLMLCFSVVWLKKIELWKKGEAMA